MRASGVEVRPLVQITGDSEFNEVYLTDVRVPDTSRIGGVGEGWRVAITTLMNERVAVGGAVPPRDGGAIGAALDVWRKRTSGRDPVEDEALRDQLVRWWVEAESLRLMNVRSAQRRLSGSPGPEGSVAKMLKATLNQRIYGFANGLLGMEGALYPGGYVPAGEGHWTDQPVQRCALRSLSNSIEGGTTEIMLNILAERVLGLPGDIRVDKDVPWTELPRS
jgi:alkylation response protein AidB-like acyl-CoA dehydrogenase